MGAQQLRNTIRKLGALPSPVVDPVPFEVYGRRVRAGIIGSNQLHGTSVPGPVLLDHHHAVIRLLSGAYARQTNHQHNRTILSILEIAGLKFTAGMRLG